MSPGDIIATVIDVIQLVAALFSDLSNVPPATPVTITAPLELEPCSALECPE